MLFQRNGHLPVGPGVADPGWGQKQAWGLEGDSPSYSNYDRDLGASFSNLLRRLTGGTLTLQQLLPPSELTMTRAGRFGAQQNSLPAARFFQSYDGAGTGRATSPIDQGGVATVPRQRSTASQRGTAWGAAELHPATTFDPFPSPGSLYPKVV